MGAYEWDEGARKVTRLIGWYINDQKKGQISNI